MSGPGNRHPSVYVGPLPVTVTQDELRKPFMAFGNVEDIKICNSNRGNIKYAFVAFSSESEAIKSQELQGKLKVGPYTPKVNYGNPKDKFSSFKPRRDGPMPAMRSPMDDFASNNRQDFASGAKGSSSGNFKDNINFNPVAEEDLVVSHVEGPTRFWAQHASMAMELKEIADALEMVCPGAQSVKGQPTISMTYACKYSADNAWYRCKIIQSMSSTESEVLYLDFGNRELVSNSSIKELPGSLSTIQPVASRYILYGLKPCHDLKSLEYAKGTERLRELTENRVLHAKIYPSVKDDTPVIIESEEVDINQEILNEGYGSRRWSATENTPRKGRDLLETKLFPKPRGQVTPPWGSPQPLAQNGGGEPGSYWNQSESSPRPELGGRPDGADSSQLKPEVERLDKLLRMTNSELIQAKEDCTRLAKLADDISKERDKAVLDLATMRGSLQALQQEKSQLLQQVEESNVSHKVRTLLSGVSKIRALRSQFPTDANTPDSIERALAAVYESRTEGMEAGSHAAAKVYDKCQMYQRAQDAIKACQGTDGLTDLIACRDQCRLMLCGAVKEFLEVAAGLPLEAKSQQLSELLTTLQRTYSSFLQTDEALDCPPLDEVVPLYMAWRAQQKAQFQEVRTKTNTARNSLSGALHSLQKLLCIDEDGHEESPSVVGILDSLLAQYHAALNDEIRYTDIHQQGDKAGSFIPMLLRAQVQELEARLKEIMQLKEMADKNHLLLADLQHWTQNRPDISEVTACRKTIKGLKSKLRHRLADLQDLVEDCSDEDADQLAQLKTNVSDIRNELQAALMDEDTKMSALAATTERHFPELILLHPDLGLREEIAYCSLVKENRSLDHFDKQHLPDVDKSTILKSSFCGKPIILKEFFFDDGPSCRDFIRNAVTYKKVVCPQLVPIECILILKKDHHAFLQLPFYEHSLTQLVLAKGHISSQTVYGILWGVLHGLYALHSGGIVHGTLHPGNIFISDKGTGVLAEVDFSRNLDQRAARGFTTFNNLQFVAPEVHAGIDSLSPACDLYCFGLLILWLLYPQHSFTLCPNGVPNIQGLQLEEMPGCLIPHLLSEDPGLRYKASDLLASQWFQRSPHSLSTKELEATTLQLRPPKTPSPPIIGRSILKKSPPAGSPADEHSPAIPSTELASLPEDGEPPAEQDAKEAEDETASGAEDEGEKTQEMRAEEDEEEAEEEEEEAEEDEEETEEPEKLAEAVINEQEENVGDNAEFTGEIPPPLDYCDQDAECDKEDSESNAVASI